LQEALLEEEPDMPTAESLEAFFRANGLFEDGEPSLEDSVW